MALSLELTDTYKLHVLSKEISSMFGYFRASFSCNSMPCSGCSGGMNGVNGVNPS